MDGKKVNTILQKLKVKYPDAKPELVFGNPYQLLVAVILSAQCTDKRVNTVTPILFDRYPDVESLAKADLSEVEEIIRPCGFYHNKAISLIEASRSIVDKFDGRVPNNLEDLRSLRGVGRKTANVVYSVAFGGQAIAVDTHVFRVSNRIGIARSSDVLKTELQLMESIPITEWSHAHHLLIFHGRYTCKALKPMCSDCPINDNCDYYISLNGGLNE